MAEHGHHDPGGHELEAVNTKLLFRLLISLTAITLLSAVVVIQWFNSQRRELEKQHAADGSFQLQQYQAKMDQQLDGIDRVAQDIVADPKLLVGLPAPSGWVHPDDMSGGAAPAAAPAEKPAEAPAPAPAEEAIPVDASPEGDKAPEPPTGNQ